MRKGIARKLITLFVPLIFTASVYGNAQCAPNAFWSSIRSTALPDIFSRYYDFRNDISQKEPLQGNEIGLHVARVDSLYQLAIRLTEGNIHDAVFLCSLGTLPYHSFPAYLPLLGVQVKVPISTESIECFERRYRNLPSNIFRDTPPEGDRDKLTHFFGAAWLHLVLKAKGAVALIGELIEVFESTFKLEGFDDRRDIAANDLGIRFARALMNDEDALPSSILVNRSLSEGGP